MRTTISLLLITMSYGSVMAQCVSEIPENVVTLQGSVNYWSTQLGRKFWICANTSNKYINGNNSIVWIEDGATSININGSTCTIYYKGSAPFGIVGGFHNTIYAASSAAVLSTGNTNVIIPCGEGGVQFSFVDYPEVSCVTVGMDDLDTQELQVSPNPATGMLSIQAGNLLIRSAVIYDLEGREVAHKNNNDPYRISVEDLSPGTYLLKLFTDQGPVTRRFMKM